MNKKVKYMPLVLLSGLVWISCKDTPAPPKMETPTTNQVVIEEGQNLDEKQVRALAAEKGVEISESELVGMGKSKIIGSNVSIRQNPSNKAEKVGVFENQEPVKVLTSSNAKNEGEAILSKSITLKGSGGSISLAKGKAVVIEGYDEAKNSYLVSYEDPKKGKMQAQIDAVSAETIIYATWYKVERKSGETGWVLSKFLKSE
jgi:hypothetical protein